MISRMWIKLIIFFVPVIYISCSNNSELKKENDFYFIKPHNSNVEVDLRLSDNKQISSCSIKDNNQKFSIMFNLLEDGNCSLQLNTKIFEETVNTQISEKSNKYVSQYLVINNKTYILQEIDNNGQVLTQKKNE